MNSIFLIKGIKKAAIASLLCCTLLCSFFSEDSKAQNNMDTEASKPTAQTSEDGYIVEPNYEHPKFKELDAAFAKQDHRFEIDRCEFKYNEQSFFIGDSEEKIISILGEPDTRFTKTLDGKSYNLNYKKLKLWFVYADNKVESFVLRMSDYEGHKDTPYKIIKFRKVPYQLDMSLNEFIELSDLSHEKTLEHDTSAFYVKNEKECSSLISTEIGSTPNYHSTGGGHMTMRGAFNPKSTGTIRSFVISSETQTKN